MMSESRRPSRDIGRRSDLDLDQPPYSRLFVVCDKSTAEPELREAFGQYGTLDDVWFVKDRQTGDPKGVVYIKFAKTSQAAEALEALHGKTIGSHSKPIKVMIATSRSEAGSMGKRDGIEEERVRRLFVVVPKTNSEADVKDYFSTFGRIDDVMILRDKRTKESKGFAFVSYLKLSHAALAYENCEKSYKAVFAEPKPPKDQRMQRDSFDQGSGNFPGSGMMMSRGGGPPPPFAPYNSGYDAMDYGPSDFASTRLNVIAQASLTRNQLIRLFEIIPGLEFFDVLSYGPSRDQVYVSVKYREPRFATWAREKLNAFEYPPGFPLTVLDASESPIAPTGFPSSFHGGSNARDNNTPRIPQDNRNTPGGGGNPDLQKLAEALSQATSIIQAAGLGNSSPKQPVDTYNPGLCSVRLPPPQPLAPLEAPCVERLFVVCNPRAPPTYALKDCFNRFGNLIDVYMLQGKNFGYAKFASKESAARAMDVLYGQEVCGMRLKVLQADEHPNKRQKIGDTP